MIRILVNNVWSHDVPNEDGLLTSVAKYIEEHIPPESQRQISGYCLSDVARLKAGEYTVEARAVPEEVAV